MKLNAMVVFFERVPGWKGTVVYWLNKFKNKDTRFTHCALFIVEQNTFIHLTDQGLQVLDFSKYNSIDTAKFIRRMYGKSTFSTYNTEITEDSVVTLCQAMMIADLKVTWMTAIKFLLGVKKNILCHHWIELLVLPRASKVSENCTKFYDVLQHQAEHNRMFAEDTLAQDRSTTNTDEKASTDTTYTQ